MANTYFDLPPEMGGTQFGPFAGGAVQIGTDPSQCQILLNQAPGIAPVHVIVTDQSNGTYLVAPVQRGFGLFLSKNNGHPQPVGGATIASPGDAVVIGQPHGPRFIIRRDERAATRVGAGNLASGAAGGVGGKVLNELWRQQKAQLMYRNPLFREFSRLSFRYRTGALSNPRVLVGLIGGAVAMVGAGIASCGGLVVAIQQGLFG